MTYRSAGARPLVLRLAPWIAIVPIAVAGCTAARESPAPARYAGLRSVILQPLTLQRPFAGLAIDEVISVYHAPLLPYIFFDSGSVSIARRYQLLTDPRHTDGFNDSTLSGSPTDLHYQILNVIGYRLRVNHGVRITVVGSTSGEPRSRETLATADGRARNVQQYLVSIWGIDASRIAVLPSIHDTSAADVAGARRVEIRSLDYDVICPVIVRDVRRYPQPGGMRFRMRNPVHDTAVARRTIEIEHAGSRWSVLHELSLVDTLSPEINWGRANNADSLPSSEEPFVATLVVTDRQGRVHRSDTVTIPIEILTFDEKIRDGMVDRRVEEYPILLRDPERGEVGATMERFIRDVVVRSIDTGSTVEVTAYGEASAMYTDRPARQIALAEKRSASVVAVLQRLVAVRPRTIVATDPRVDPMYRSRTPEGGYFNRMVLVRIVTPVRYDPARR